MKGLVVQKTEALGAHRGRVLVLLQCLNCRSGNYMERV